MCLSDGIDPTSDPLFLDLNLPSYSSLPPSGFLPTLSSGQSQGREDTNPSLLFSATGVAHSNERLLVGDRGVGLSHSLLSSTSARQLACDKGPAQISREHNTSVENAEYLSSFDVARDYYGNNISLLPEIDITPTTLLPLPSSSYYNENGTVPATALESTDGQVSRTSPLRPPKLPLPPPTFAICKICDKEFSGIAALDRHSSTEHFPCGIPGCEEVFTTHRGRGRHHKTKKHCAKAATNAYQCHCGRKTVRDDNHQRHLKTCKRAGETFDQCNCGTHAVKNREEHIAHVKRCKTHQKDPKKTYPRKHVT